MATDNTSEPAKLAAQIVNQHFGAGLTLPSANGLPDMTGFDPDELGIPTNSWLSPSFILADRDLTPGEKLYAWLIRCSDGYPLEEITFNVPKGSEDKAKWPQLFAQHVNKSARHLRAGGWNAEGEFTALEGSKNTSQFSELDLIEKSKINRLWHYNRENRTFSTAAFNSNWVQTLLLASMTLEAGATLCVQVRDITSQYLYETHFFIPKADSLENMKWTKDLCAHINLNSKMLRAGTWNSKTASVSPTDKDNALWIPQCSELAVTVQPMTWWTEQTIKAERDLTADESISTYVWDEYSNAELIEPHTFTPTNAEDRKKQNWIGAWAKSLNASKLAPYVKLAASANKSTELAKDSGEATLWQAGTGLRVFTTEPSDKNWATFSAPLDKMHKDTYSAIEIRVINDFSQRIFYQHLSRTNSSKPLTDAASWWRRTAQTVRTRFNRDGKAYIQIPDDKVLSIRTPRRSGLNINIEPSIPVAADEMEAWGIIEILKAYQKAQDDGLSEGAARWLEQKKNINKVMEDFRQKKLDIFTGLSSNDFSSDRLSGYLSYLDIAQKIETALELKTPGNRGLDNGFAEPSIFATPLPDFSVESQPEKFFFYDSHPSQHPSDFGSDHDGTIKNQQMESFAAQRLLEQHFNGADQLGTLSTHIKNLERLTDLLNKNPQQHVNKQELYRFILRSDSESVINYLESEMAGYGILSLVQCIKLATTAQRIYIKHGQPARQYPAANAYEIFYSYDPSVTFVARLTPLFRASGARLIPSLADSDFATYEQFNIYIPDGIAPPSGPLAYVGFTHAGNIWERAKILSCSTSSPYELAVPASPLCEDYGNTYRSEVFDVSGQNTTGVDPRTGLFNAHYSIATFTDLEGKGPTIDLTMRYSPLRANEAGLGDGWAFNFSSFDNRQKLLTLSTGQTVQFTEEELSQLKDGRSIDKVIVNVTATVSNNEKTLFESMTISLPSGRKEILGVGANASADYTSKHNADVISKLKNLQELISTHITDKEYLYKNWPYLIHLTYAKAYDTESKERAKTYLEERENKAKAYWVGHAVELQNQVALELAYWQTPDQHLIPKSILSSTGGELKFDWEQEQGQYLLKKISTVNETLLTATYEARPSSETTAIESTVKFILWPNTTESTDVELKLRNYLLDRINRSSQADSTVAEWVQYTYGPDPTLDRVLTSITESDGSLEAVFYEAEGMQFPAGSGWKPALPCVSIHVISPGIDQPTLRTNWQYSEQNHLGYTATISFNRFEDTAVQQGASYIYSCTETEYQGVATKRSWNGFHLQIEEQKTSPSGTGKTTQWTFSDVQRPDPRFGSPVGITTIYQDI